MNKVVVSLYDYTGEAVRPWAEAGYQCLCLDIQHPTGGGSIDPGDYYPETGGAIWKIHWDRAWLPEKTIDLITSKARGPIVMGFAFPVCTDLAASGARHWKAKAERDPHFQRTAAVYAIEAAHILDQLTSSWMIENPNGALSTLWRKWDHSFDPYQYGGYLEPGAHPRWPEYIPSQDAYTKRTNLWVGKGFVMPTERPVEPVKVTITKRDGTTTTGSPQWAMLGGKSMRTKNIRSATPRGFARAVFEINHKHIEVAELLAS